MKAREQARRRLALFALLALGCQRPPAVIHEQPAPETLAVNGLANPGFEWIADSTTNPPKYGAYWPGAFSPVEGDGTDLIVEERPFRGQRCLRLGPDDGEVWQKIVADPRWTERMAVGLAVRLGGGGALLVTLEDGPGRTVTARVTEGGLCPSASMRVAGPDGWTRVWLPLGHLFEAQHGERPVPRLNLRLRCVGPAGAVAHVDEMVAPVHGPRTDAAGLGRQIADLIEWQLETWYLTPQEGGLRLVDPDTGYADTLAYDVRTGSDRVPAGSVGLHSIHSLLLKWLRLAHERGWDDQIERWTPHLERATATLLAHQFDPFTGLPRTVKLESLEPNDRSPVTVAPFVEFLLDAMDLAEDDDLRAACLAQARKIADTLLDLQRQHDLPRATVFNRTRLDRATGKLEGETPNWFGHIPNRLTPKGKIDTPRRFNTAWAIVTGKSFWYHLFKSASAIMEVHARLPREGDLAGVRRALSLYERKWDATRYDLENDTDDHYGYLCEDLLVVLEHGGKQLPGALALLQQATDHRLPRNAASAGDTPWIQGIRLGTPCAGDSPRAFVGVLGLMELDPAIRPTARDRQLYTDAILELARNDWKGRQLTNSQFTDSFFGQWEMVCICYRGTFQGDCRSHPAEWWHGDVGDTFGGPPTWAIEAQAVAWRVATPGQRQQILSALGVIHHITETTMRRQHGYLAGLDKAVARRYELLEKYVTGVSTTSLAGLAHVLAWARLLPHLDQERAPPTPRLHTSPEAVGRPGAKPLIEVTGPPGGRVRVVSQAGPQVFPGPLSDRDGRMLAVDPAALTGDWTVRLDDRGRATLTVEHPATGPVVLQPLLLDPGGGAPLTIGPALVLPARGD